MSSLFEDEIEEDIDNDVVQNDDMNQQDPFPNPRENNYYISNHIIEADFLNLISKEKMPHAIIFSGQKGIGKATFGYRLARFILKYGKTVTSEDSLFGDAAPAELPHSMEMSVDDAVFRRIASGGHADFLALSPFEGKKGLDVEQIRKVAPFLRKTASEDGGWRVVLVDDADTMNNNAQNALLKILEEPPAKTLLILISHNSGAFLPTIRSRCRYIDIPAPDLEVYEQLMRRKDPYMPHGQIKTLYEYSSGSIGKTIQFIDFNGLDLLQEVTGHLAPFPKADFEQIHLFCERFGRAGKEEQWQNFCDFIIWMFQTLALSKAKKQELPDTLQQIEHLNTLWSLEEQLEICQMLESKIRRANFANLDKKETALEIFMLLADNNNK